MANEIQSSELWDRLALILGPEKDKLGERPAGSSAQKFTLDRPFDLEWLGDGLKDDAVLDRFVSDVRACARHLAFAGPDVKVPPPSEGIVATYLAVFEYRSGGGHVTKIDVRYTAKDPYEAIAGAIKFWLNRQQIPELFGQLYAVNVWHDVLGPIGADGMALNGSSFSVFEWKYDSYPGAPLETSALVRIAELIRVNGRRNEKGGR